jgi:hypothetical protein
MEKIQKVKKYMFKRIVDFKIFENAIKSVYNHLILKTLKTF